MESLGVWASLKAASVEAAVVQILSSAYMTSMTSCTKVVKDASPEEGDFMKRERADSLKDRMEAWSKLAVPWLRATTQ